MRRRAKTDANQAEIARALRDIGCSVHDTAAVGGGFPDLVVGRGGRTYLIEIKTRLGSFTGEQLKFHREWSGHIAVVRTVAEAFRVVGAVAETPRPDLKLQKQLLRSIAEVR